MGVISVTMHAINTLPVLAGERDILKVIQFLPGVQAGQEGTTGYFVRGGNIDQNLVQLDEATIYNPNHLFGLFSTFNTFYPEFWHARGLHAHVYFEAAAVVIAFISLGKLLEEKASLSMNTMIKY